MADGVNYHIVLDIVQGVFFYVRFNGSQHCKATAVIGRHAATLASSPAITKHPV